MNIDLPVIAVVVSVLFFINLNGEEILARQQN